MDPDTFTACECCGAPGTDFNKDIEWLCAECLADEDAQAEVDEFWNNLEDI